MNKRRMKFNYYENTREQLNVLRDRVYVMHEQPPGSDVMYGESISSDFTDSRQGRLPREGSDEYGVLYDEQYHASRRAAPDGRSIGREDSPFTRDSIPWCWHPYNPCSKINC